MESLIGFAYFLVAIIFILGLKQMSSPKSARDGIVLAGWGMLIAVGITFFSPSLHGVINFILMLSAIFLGALIAWFSGTRVAMTDMPQMIAIYNGMGGGAAAAIAAMEMLHQSYAPSHIITLSLAVLGAYIGMISFSGSIVAFAKLQGIMQRTFALPKHSFFNMIITIVSLILAFFYLQYPNSVLLMLALFSLLTFLGITLTLPVGGANMPVVISLFNAMTGLAVGIEGFVLDNAAMMIAGTVVGASGTLLTQLMAKAMNQSLSTILFNPPSSVVSTSSISGAQKPIDSSDAGILLAYASKVIIIPGYGLAVAQAQHKLWELVQLLQQRQVAVKFAIHPVAGRMPGHMNVLLAEAGVPYDLIYDLDDINPEFANADVAVVIGANDVVNPIARTDPNSPIFGMPILNADKAKQVIVIKRGQGKGFSGIENSLFYLDNTRMFYGDGQEAIHQLISAVKEV